MKRALKRWGLRGGIAAAILAGAAAGYLLRGPGPPELQPERVAAAEEEPQAEWWTCSMHPHIRKPEPGLCPICKMPLIPLETRQDEQESGLRRFATTEAGAALMEIQTAPVERRFVRARVRLVGKVSPDESRVRHITAWVGGRIERLYADFTGTSVRAGDHMVELYSPELIAAQEELLQAKRTAREMGDGEGGSIFGSAADTVEAAREKLRLLGLTAEQIRTLEQNGGADDRLTIHAPIGGTVIRIHALEGEYLQTGARIYTIADLRSLWVKLDAYEADLKWLRYGQQVTFTTEAYPGETFVGRIAFISPVVDPATRTVKVRVNLPNPGGKLKPDMLVRGIAEATAASGGRVLAPDLTGKWISPMHPEIVKDGPGRCDICGMELVPAEQLAYAAVGPAEATPPLVVPASAVLVTGTRAVVYVEDPDAERPTFEGREIVLGPRADDHYIVEHGLSEGERVVVRGNFKIDSALQIRARPSMMAPEPGAAAAVHQHHPSPAPSPPQDGEPAAGRAPQGFLRELEAVASVAGRVGDALAAGDLPDARNLFEELGQRVRSVDASHLPTDVATIWREQAMLLGNDAYEGSHARTLAEAQRVAALLDGHVRQVRSHFGPLAADGGHGGADRQRATTHDAVPEDLAAGLDALWRGYRELHRALAADDPSRARAAARDALEALQTAAAPASLIAEVSESLAGLAGTAELEAQRSHFRKLSGDLAGLLRRVRSAELPPIYRLHCPMAFGGTGADWLQPAPDVRNPYFGASMLECGSVMETLFGSPDSGMRTGNE